MSKQLQKVGQQFLLVGALLALTVAATAAGPARIGELRLLQDGQIDRLCFNYAGPLQYREYHFPSANYGYIDFEPAVFDQSKMTMKPTATTVREVVVRAADAGQQRVRVLYKLDGWVRPTLHDRGKQFEIRFTPSAKAPAPAAPETPALDSLLSGDPSVPVELASAAADADSPVAATPSAARSVSEAVEIPESIPPAPVRVSMPALGGEGMPLSAEEEATTPPSILEELDIITPGAAFVPEAAGQVGTKVTGSRGYEIVDLSDPIFQKEVSLNFKEADLQNSIRLLARSADLNIVMDPSRVRGTLTVELNNVPVGAALTSILRANNLELIRESGGIYRVVPASQVTRQEVEEITVHFQLNWVDAQAVQSIIQPVIDGDVAADSIGNAVIVTDTPLRIEEIANVIKRIDKPEKQVMLEARLVEMNSRYSKSLEQEWQLYKADSDGAYIADMLHGMTRSPVAPDPIINDLRLANPWGIPIGPGGADPFSLPMPGSTRSPFGGVDSLSVSGGRGNWAFGTDVQFLGQDFQLDMFLSAFEARDLAKVLVAPRVVTVNNQPATINVIRRVPYSSTVVGAGGAQSVTFSYEDVGIEMTITPNITNNDYVRMRLEPRQKILIDQQGLARPTIDERFSSTNVIVKDEETAIVAGLRQQDFADGTDGVPFFHTIPVLGWLFKDKSYRNDKTDLLAFVTPHILKQSQILTEEEKTRYNEIDVQWDLPDKFYDDVKVELGQ